MAPGHWRGAVRRRLHGSVPGHRRVRRCTRVIDDPVHERDQSGLRSAGHTHGPGDRGRFRILYSPERRGETPTTTKPLRKTSTPEPRLIATLDMTPQDPAEPQQPPNTKNITTKPP